MDDLSRLHLILLASGSMAFTLTLYHCILILWRKLRQQPHQQHQLSEMGPLADRPENSTTTIELIPTHKYQKDTSLERGESICPVCLSEFEEGEELCTLPECMHTFHKQCIDMWLHSHSNCPMCRTDTTLSSCVFRVSNSG